MNRQESLKPTILFSEINIPPENYLPFSSPEEIVRLLHGSNQRLYAVMRNCALTVLNSGIKADNNAELFKKYSKFKLNFTCSQNWLRLSLSHAPAHAFVDGVLIQKNYDQLLSVIRDLVFGSTLSINSAAGHGAKSTEIVSKMLRNAKTVKPIDKRACIVCWGGHSINSKEYNYARLVGQELGLRVFDICTGSGPGVMKAVMHGAFDGHQRQGWRHGRFIGLSEVGIIATEPPNSLVSELVIMPDMEKRLEAFVRVAHGIIIFPGGPGTVEEVLYLVAILLDPENKKHTPPIIFTGPEDAQGTIEAYIDFLKSIFNEKINSIKVIIEDPERVATEISNIHEDVSGQQSKKYIKHDFNWKLNIPKVLRDPFVANHKTMAGLKLTKDLPSHELAHNLRCLFSGIVAGNIKSNTRELITRDGPFEIVGDPQFIDAAEKLLKKLVSEKRMKLHGVYEPCYRLKNNA
ncbi:nucleotide 5'-monophosphate nucleosidase PpnN [Litorivicinus sp.]|nr:nucleotide 5'-monophosphate nucleosidase PpnN [Litorivicinus sp.]